MRGMTSAATLTEGTAPSLPSETEGTRRAGRSASSNRVPAIPRGDAEHPASAARCATPPATQRGLETMARSEDGGMA
jgi:hypothetical protein